MNSNIQSFWKIIWNLYSLQKNFSSKAINYSRQDFSIYKKKLQKNNELNKGIGTAVGR